MYKYKIKIISPFDKTHSFERNLTTDEKVYVDYVELCIKTVDDYSFYPHLTFPQGWFVLLEPVND